MSKVRLDLEECKMQVGDRTYIYKDNEYSYLDSDEEFTQRRWYKEDKRFAVSADSEDPEHKIPVEETYDIASEDWVFLRVRIKDRAKVKKLNRTLEKTMERLEAKREAEKRGRDREEEEEEEEESEESSRGEESDSDEQSDREHHKSKQKSGSKRKSRGSPERTKWGMRIYSNDETHFFGIGVWKSTKYEGCATVRLSVAGRNYTYTLDRTQMKALRRELSRAEPT